MADVFINYRTGDGDKTAALIDQELSRRFGRGCTFRASKSIPPGNTYPDDLLSGLRSSSVLLAVIGPDWTNFQARLRDTKDWVRKEILEAFECQLQVIPVLDGRKTDRLNKTDLPEELTPLAEIQSVPFDSTHDTEAGLKRLGDLVAEMVPGLHDLDAADPSPGPGSVANSAGDVSGTAVQSRDFSGDVGNTVIKGSSGTVHSGKGNIYQNSRHESGPRHVSGNGMTYFEGDNHGGIQHRHGDSDGPGTSVRREDDGR